MKIGTSMHYNSTCILPHTYEHTGSDSTGRLKGRTVVKITVCHCIKIFRDVEFGASVYRTTVIKDDNQNQNNPELAADKLLARRILLFCS